MAKCPAHEDRSASLSVRELDDGRILLNDFGGCETADVLAVVGLRLSDLFSEPLAHHIAPTRDRNHWHAQRAAFDSLRGELDVIALASSDLAAGKQPSQIDADRLVSAVARVRDVRGALYGRGR
jgi:hypothetical protein